MSVPISVSSNASTGRCFGSSCAEISLISRVDKVLAQIPENNRVRLEQVFLNRYSGSNSNFFNTMHAYR